MYLSGVVRKKLMKLYFGGPLLMKVPVNVQGQGDINLMRLLVLDNEL